MKSLLHISSLLSEVYTGEHAELIILRRRICRYVDEGKRRGMLPVLAEAGGEVFNEL